MLVLVLALPKYISIALIVIVIVMKAHRLI